MAWTYNPFTDNFDYYVRQLFNLEYTENADTIDVIANEFIIFKYRKIDKAILFDAGIVTEAY